MPRPVTQILETHALPARAIEFCRGAMTVIAAILGIGALVLLISGVVALRTPYPSFGQDLSPHVAVSEGTKAPLP